MERYSSEEHKLHDRVNELFPKGKISHAHPDTVANMVTNLWSSGIDRLTKRLREIDQARIKSASKAWTKGVM